MKTLFTIALLLLSFLHAKFAPAFGVDIITLPKPPFRYFTTQKSYRKHIRVKKLLEKPNTVTNDSVWFRKYRFYPPKIRPKAFFRVNRNIQVPRTYNQRSLLELYFDNRYLYAVYGGNYLFKRYLFIMDIATKKFLYGFDFINYTYSLKQREFAYGSIEFAKIDKNVLYFQTSNIESARDNRGKSAYITAYDLIAKRVLWRSKPLVARANNFTIYKDYIISGYGFTREKDYLYFLDKIDGKVIKRYRLKSSPEYIMQRANRVYLRTYNRDYILKIE